MRMEEKLEHRKEMYVMPCRNSARASKCNDGHTELRSSSLNLPAPGHWALKSYYGISLNEGEGLTESKVKVRCRACTRQRTLNKEGMRDNLLHNM